MKQIREPEAVLNRFLRSVRVLTVRREFENNGEGSLWCMAVEYLSGSMDQPRSCRPLKDDKEHKRNI